MNKYLIIISLLIWVATKSFAQVPEIGKPCPDFVFSDVDHYLKKSVKLSDFKGKHLILDFFSTGCVVCVQSFPKTNELQKKFSDKLQILLVGINAGKSQNLGVTIDWRGKDVKDMYGKFRKQMNLDLAVAYDSILCKQFKLTGTPYLIWIDDKGIAKAITGTLELTQANVELFLKGEDFKSTDRSVKGKAIVSEKDNQMQNLLREDYKDALYYSKLSLWDGQGYTHPPGDLKLSRDIQANGFPLGHLYTFSHFGTCLWTFTDSIYTKLYPRPILELTDKSKFDYSNPGVNWYGLYSFVLRFKENDRSIEHKKKAMQNELFNCFGYSSSIEKRMVPCWNLIKVDNKIEKLKTSGSPLSIKGTHAGFSFKNIPLKSLLQRIANYHLTKHPVFINKTNIDYNIDIDFNAIMTDLEDVQRELKVHGLELVKGETEMEVVVIRDATSK